MYPVDNHHNGGYSSSGLFFTNWFRLVTSNRPRFRGSESQCDLATNKKYEFWVLMAICVDRIAHEFTDFALYASISLCSVAISWSCIRWEEGRTGRGQITKKIIAIAAVVEGKLKLSQRFHKEDKMRILAV